LADREYLRPPQLADFPNGTLPAFRYFQQVAQAINAIKTDLHDMETYADNAARSSRRLIIGVGEIYATGHRRTKDSCLIRKVNHARINFRGSSARGRGAAC
jgi:hypothetical protein